MTIKIIDGKRYNTETATCVAAWDNGLGYSDFRHCEESLYRTPKGAWFTSGAGGAMTSYSQACGDSTGGGEDIRPLTDDEALEWLERNDETTEIETYFASKLEDA